jgi:hypothetical protein
MSMDALRLRRLGICLGFSLVLNFSTTGKFCRAASYQTVNFTVTAERADVAEKVGKEAEFCRRSLAVFWLGKPLPNWSRPCKIQVNEGAMGAGGQTTFQFVRGEVLNWRMQVQGSLERILDSVIPHEVNHTIFACHFRRPLPRWADEGAATLFEHRSEQLKQLALLNDVVRNRDELISLRDLLSMKDYPRGHRPMLTLYAQGYALADFLVQQKGRQVYLKLISDGERIGWEDAIRRNFDHEGIESLEKNWQGWVLAGMPKLTGPQQSLAAVEPDAIPQNQEAARPQVPARQTVPSRSNGRGIPAGVVRSQSPQESAKAPRTRSAQGSIQDYRQSATSSSTGGFRDHSIEAPAPRPTRFAEAEESRNKVAPSTGDAVPVTNDQASAEGLLNSEGPSFDELNPGFEKTSRTETDEPRRPDVKFDFNGVLLPRERNRISGDTPRWAGFPGATKLF